MIYETTNFHTFWQAKLHIRHSIIIMISLGGTTVSFFLVWFEEEKQRIRERVVNGVLSMMIHLRYSCMNKTWFYTNADQRLCAYYYKKQKIEWMFKKCQHIYAAIYNKKIKQPLLLALLSWLVNL